MGYNKKRNNPVFYNLANKVAEVLKKNNGEKKLSKKDFTKQQKEQVERMMELEGVFKNTINSYKQSDKIYRKFLMHIKIEKGNILSARPYFREDSETFGAYISPAFKDDDIVRIKNFNINYKFMVYVIENWKGKLPPRALQAWEEHQVVRQKIIENSMPLAINEAMKFYRSVPKDHLSLMDMINAAVSGLCTGTDKWVGPFTPVFRSVCIGRMKSNIMDIYNQTVLHYYPSDKKIIYKANLLKNRERIEDMEILLVEINKYLLQSGDKRVLELHELEDLLNGASVCGIESSQSDEDGANIYDTYIDESSDIELKAQKTETVKQVLLACESLDIIEKKILRLKGVDL